MSTLKAEALAREFCYNGIRIPDPGPALTIDQVRDLLTPNWPSGRASTSITFRSTSRMVGSA